MRINMSNLFGADRSISRHAILGYLLIIFLFMGLGGWAAITNISGAIIAHGQVVVTSDSQKVQHPTGGVVKDILVSNGSIVREGDILIRLDETVTRANLDMLQKGLTELATRRARLIAERDGAREIDFPAREALAISVAENAIQGERRLFATRRAVRDSMKAQLAQRIRQTADELTGLRTQLRAKAREIELATTELSGARELRQKELMAITKYTALEREAVRLEGERGQLIANIAQAEGKITEIELKTAQIDQDLASEVGKELREVEYRINELAERKVAAADQLRRTIITAPQAGVVHELALHTIGGVISPGDAIMLIVPQGDPLMAEVRIQPQDVDQIQIGQKAILRFSAFNQNTTPDGVGTVRHLSADLVSDPRTGAQFYRARIEVTTVSIGQKDFTLLPGMPVDVFLHTGERTILSYLLKPFTEQIAHAFRYD